jgi:hypothetical protein
MARKEEARTRMIVGLFVMILSVVALISLFLIGQTEGSWKPKTEISTDFRTISGLRRGSPVQLAGVEIGTVSAINFVERISGAGTAGAATTATRSCSARPPSSARSSSRTRPRASTRRACRRRIAPRTRSA